MDKKHLGLLSAGPVGLAGLMMLVVGATVG